jgi:Zn-dependent M28 family amino/carboxypeptidase
VPGANDGASGTAVLLELLAYVRDLPSRAGVDVIFWDAEDMGIAGTGAYFCQGSEYYARHPLAPAPQKGILIDMIGDHDLRIPVEVFSMQYAPGLVREVWDIAGKWGYRQIFPRRVEYEVMDDHVPLNRIAGIRTINLIDFHYTLRGRNIWHTIDDLPAYCSPESLRIVADVLMSWLSDL